MFPQFRRRGSLVRNPWVFDFAHLATLRTADVVRYETGEANAVLAEASEGCRRIAESAGKSAANFDWIGVRSIYELSGIPERWKFRRERDEQNRRITCRN